jgi:hypothetical protein
MSYFDTQLGRRPIVEPYQKTEKQEMTAIDPQPLFLAYVGRRPDSIDTPSASDGQAASIHLTILSPGLPTRGCPLCHGPLEEQGGLYRCLGRCGACWLAEASGRLIDLAALPFGICGCCRPPQALVRGDQGTICPASARVYLLLPNGTSVLADTLPYGACRCCAPPMPLIRQGDALACLARPEQRYQRAGDQLVLLAPASSAADIGAAIDTALRRNSARLTVNGLFDLD